MEKRANTKLTLDEGLAVARDIQPDRSSAALASILGVKRAYLLRRSVDARRKQDVHFVATVGVGSGTGVPLAPTPLDERALPMCDDATLRPVVVGMGPAGLFAALELAEAGLRPLVIERGAPVSERTADIAAFLETRKLDTESNVQFGEGGAGTFSDGKLTCGKNSPFTQDILETFVAAGAPGEILWQAKPHIGTDVLGEVVMRIRERIVACGGEVRFHTRLVGMGFDSGGRLLEVRLAGKGDAPETLAARQLVLACGHSARDTFNLLEGLEFELEQKPFSIGVRIEHEQRFINHVQYGQAAEHPALGAADYKLVAHLGTGRSVYTFCMCPGGEVVAASSETGGLCVNGMSRQARNGANANAALLCNVVPEDYADAQNPLAGVAFQREWERAAFAAGGRDWRAPVQRVASFMGSSQKSSHCPSPSYPLGVAEAALCDCLPAFATDALREALPLLDRKLKGFADAGAVMTGIEARSSSPVRVLRDAATLMATKHAGVYPCGEGAGYAGGIMSSAIDGLRVANAIIASRRLSAGVSSALRPANTSSMT